MDGSAHETGFAMGVILPFAWAAVVLFAGAPTFRRRARVIAPVVARPKRRSWRPRRVPPSVLVVVGLGAYLLGALVPAAAISGAVLLYRRHRSIATRRARAQRIRAALPDAADLASVAAEAGAAPLAVVEALSRWASEPVSGAAAIVLHRWTAGERFTVALDALVEELGPPAAPIVRAMVSADRDGAPLGPALRTVADQLRADRRRSADAAVRRLGVSLLFPLTFCVLPALALVVLAPVVFQLVHSLRL